MMRAPAGKPSEWTELGVQIAAVESAESVITISSVSQRAATARVTLAVCPESTKCRGHCDIGAMRDLTEMRSKIALKRQ